jgi:hypothetical protein
MQHTAIGSINDWATMGTYISKEQRIKELQNSIAKASLELETLLLDDPAVGPTGRELNTHESLKNAWNEYKSIRKLLGL